MLDHLTSTQLSEWEAYDRLDPIGSWREDYRMASIQATLVNIHNAMNTKEGGTPTQTSATDFLPIWDKVEREKLMEQKNEVQSVDEIKRNLMSVFGGGKNYIVQDGKRIRIPKPKK